MVIIDSLRITDLALSDLPGPRQWHHPVSVPEVLLMWPDFVFLISIVNGDW